MPLQTVYRPETLEQFYGNDALKASLESVLSRKEDLPHTFLFTGPSGCGKTTIARIVASMVGCHGWDLHYFNAASTRGIDTVRQVISEMNLAPTSGKVKVYMFDECHQITPAAQEAFLKETEQPPPHVFFIFCTTEPEQLKVTFKRRSFVGELKALTRSEVTELIKDVLEAEKITDFPEELIKKIALSCNGSPGIALSLLDSVIDLEDDKLALEVIEDRTVSEIGINKLCYCLLDNRLTEDEKWRQVKTMIQSLSGEPESNRRAILGYFNVVMLGDRMPSSAPEIMSLFLDNYFSSGKSGLILSCFLACKVRG